MNKIISFAAKMSAMVSLFMASGIGEALKDFFIWLFDKGCYPEKHHLPNWDQVMSLFQ